MAQYVKYGVNGRSVCQKSDQVQKYSSLLAISIEVHETVRYACNNMVFDMLKSGT